jgi:transcriptional regulator with XRE-family HTH domain
MLRTNGTALQALRTGRGIRQDALAARAGISAAYLSQIEHGTRQPDIKVTVKLADELGVKLAAVTYPAPDTTPALDPVQA